MQSRVHVCVYSALIEIIQKCTLNTSSFTLLSIKFANCTCNATEGESEITVSVFRAPGPSGFGTKYTHQTYLPPLYTSILETKFEVKDSFIFGFLPKYVENSKRLCMNTDEDCPKAHNDSSRLY